MMLIREAGYEARREPDRGQPLVYIDYLESAPWNLQFVTTPQYLGVGQMLVREATRRSVEIGFRGRVGLHSLPQVVSFCERKCGFLGCGPDSEYHGLVYFEFTAERGAAFSEVCDDS